MNRILKLAVPTGSLQESVTSLLRDAGYQMELEPRSYRPKIGDPEIWVKMLRPQEIPNLVADGIYDVGISGQDWVIETGARVVKVLDLEVGRFKLVLAVAADSPVKRPEDLSRIDKPRISTEYVSIARSYLENHGVTNASIHFSWGATEAKPPEEADAIIDGFATGETLLRNNLRVVDEILDSSAGLFANEDSMKDDWKRAKIEGMKIMLSGALMARKKVLLKLNVPAQRLDEIAGMVPAMEKPTISKLYGQEWYALETVAPKNELVRLIPELKRRGAKDIIVYDLKKVIP